MISSPAHTSEKLTIHNVRNHITGIDTQVPLLDGSYRTYTNFDNAASTPALTPVVETLDRFMLWYASIHRGTGYKSRISTQAYDDAHEIALEFVGANPETNTAIFGKNTTEAINKLAHRMTFKPGDIVITTIMEHHSNDLPWRQRTQVEHVAVDENGAIVEEHLDELLKKYAGHVRLLVITGASNVTGYINPVHRFARKAHAAGAEILVDTAQFAPHRKIDMLPDNDPEHLDYVVISAHKMYAPYGCGALIGKKDVFLKGDPDLVGGGTVDIVTVDNVKWAGLPDREEAGSPNVVGAVAQARAMQCLNEIGMDALAEHEANLTAYLLEKLNRMDRIHLYGQRDPKRSHERVGVVPFSVDGMSHYLVAAILSVEGGIGVRNGCFCAHPYLFRLLNLDEQASLEYQNQIINGSRAKLPGLVRISFGCYNNQADVDWLVEVLDLIVHEKYKGKYIQEPVRGEYHAQGFSPDPHFHFSLRQ